MLPGHPLQLTYRGRAPSQPGATTTDEAAVTFATRAEEIPRLAGAYVLVVDLSRPLTVKLAGRPPASLRPGRYLYCGSAKGPGGLQARVARHMRRGKAVRWHIDRLTELGCV